MESCYGESRLDQGGPTTMAVTQQRGSGGPRDPRGRGWRGVATNWDARSQRDPAGEPRAPGPGRAPALSRAHPSCPSIAGTQLLGETGTLRKEALLGLGIWYRSSHAAPPSCPRCQSPRLRADQLIALDSPPPFLGRQGEAGVAIFSLQLLCPGSCEVPGAWGCGAEGYRVGAKSGAPAPLCGPWASALASRADLPVQGFGRKQWQWGLPVWGTQPTWAT